MKPHPPKGCEEFSTQMMGLSDKSWKAYASPGGKQIKESGLGPKVSQE
jgi:hypothetical protein